MADTKLLLDNYDTFISKLCFALNNIGKKIIPIIYTDIKYFRFFNDTYGYDMGDKLIIRLADLLSCEKEYYICGTNVVADNFVTAISIEGYTYDQLYNHIFNRISEIERILQDEFSSNRIKLSVGVYFISSENASIKPETAISNANLARKQSKENGNRSMVVFRKEMSEELTREIDIIGSLDAAIKNHEFTAYYQPKIDSKTKKIVGAEALVRWIKSDGTFIFPDQFIPTFEKSGQIVDVDYFMYNEVFSFIKKTIDRNLPIVPISLNVSREHLKNLDIVDFIKDLMKKYDLNSKFLEFELTETICMEDTVKVIDFIEAFHKIGIKVSMDDFGSGYSSLNLLSELPLDIIKLDKCFLHSADIQNRDKVIISNIINMTKELEMKSLCEGVETSKQSEFLKDIGCDIQQGFYFSKPIPSEMFENLLLNKKNY